MWVITSNSGVRCTFREDTSVRIKEGVFMGYTPHLLIHRNQNWCLIRVARSDYEEGNLTSEKYPTVFTG